MGVLVVWTAAFLATVAIGIFVTEERRIPWTLVAFGWVILLSFAVQLWYGRTAGYIQRVAASMIGALLLMGLISVGFGMASLVQL